MRYEADIYARYGGHTGLRAVSPRASDPARPRISSFPFIVASEARPFLSLPSFMGSRRAKLALGSREAPGGVVSRMPKQPPTRHIARLARDVPALPTRRRDEHRRCGGTACNDIGTVHTHTSPISPRVLCIVESEAPSFLSLPFFYGEGGAKRRVGWFLACRSSPHPSHRSLRSRCARPPHKRGRDGVRRSLPAYLSNFVAQNTPLRSRRAMRASFELCKAF